ncbi:VRR-NUC domain-containing protein [Fusobacterium necrophorum]|uniref:VRR-NUC domain-containing protein n=1 Tax=Fusobacterium necrophorum TaxID=859 RepID=UPI002012E732|nr:VRR-NUC domain-containing protein [Fusobacterium necrophorum]MDK4486751.1 VRR-NUC domain-containing protein [Fusobacterium necrophorum]MDK4505122.1 VRR-NUC domain-containing protein [Fusobacterium necrophorum]
MKLKKTEKEIEQKLKRRIESLGGLCLKWTSPGIRGVPDRICIMPGGDVLFVELKAEGKKNNLSPLQKNIHKKLKALGHVVCVVSSYEEVNDLIETWCMS